jgi:hypothetical protein
MDKALAIGLAWFLLFVVIVGGVTAFRHGLDASFVGFLVLNAVSAYLLTTSIRDAARPPRS